MYGATAKNEQKSESSAISAVNDYNGYHGRARFFLKNSVVPFGMKMITTMKRHPYKTRTSSALTNVERISSMMVSDLAPTIGPSHEAAPANLAFHFINSVTYFGRNWWDRQDACPTDKVISSRPSLYPVGEYVIPSMES